jgi:hypothetical protein
VRALYPDETSLDSDSPFPVSLRGVIETSCVSPSQGTTMTADPWGPAVLASWPSTLARRRRRVRRPGDRDGSRRCSRGAVEVADFERRHRCLSGGCLRVGRIGGVGRLGRGRAARVVDRSVGPNGPAQRRSIEVRTGDRGAREVRAGEVGIRQVGVDDLRSTEVRRGEVRVTQVRPFEIRGRQVGAAQIRPGEVCTRQVGSWARRPSLDVAAVDRGPARVRTS